MDDNGHRENGRHKPPQGQWLIKHKPSMKQIMGIMEERDAAIQERNLVISEKKKAALAERDLAILQRDSAIAERNNTIMERDNAISTLKYRENAMNNMSPCPPSCQIARGVKHMHHPHQHSHHLLEPQYNNIRDMPVPMSPIAPEPAKARRPKRPKKPKPARKTSKSSKKVKQESEDLNKTMLGKNGLDMGCGDDDLNGQMKQDWKDQDLGLNLVAFDETTMPVPICSCTGVLRPCYKWGIGGFMFHDHGKNHGGERGFSHSLFIKLVRLGKIHGRERGISHSLL